jgi:hypothetical protein
VRIDHGGAGHRDWRRKGEEIVRTRTIITIVIAACAWSSTPASAQGMQEMAPIHCLSVGEQQRLATQFTEALKPYGLDDATKLAATIQTLMMEAIDKRAKADDCTEKAGDAAPRRCKAEETAADDAEKRIEKLGESMEKLEKDLMTIRARYRKC